MISLFKNNTLIDVSSFRIPFSNEKNKEIPKMHWLRLYTISIVLLFIFFIAACQPFRFQEEQLRRVQAIIESDPKQALLILDSIDQPERMSTDVYMAYTVARVQAKYKCYEDITKDSLILEAGNYFDKNKDYRQAALAYFYSASYYREKNQKDRALSAFLKAEMNVQKVSDDRLEGMIAHNIGELYYFNDSLDVAKRFLIHAVISFGEEKQNLYFKQQTLNYIGHIFRRQGNIDSSRYYYNQTYLIAKDINDRNFQYFSLNNTGVLLTGNRKYEDAKQYFNRALQLVSRKEDSVKVHLNLAKIFYQTNKTDSVDYYLSLIDTKISEVKSLDLLSSLYEFLADYKYYKCNFKDALQYEKLKGAVNEKILLSKNINKLVQAKSEFQLSLKKRQMESEQFIFYLLLFIGIVVSAILFFACYFKQKTKIQKEKNRLLEERNLVLEKEKNVLTESQKLLDEKVESFVFLYILYRNITDEWIDVEREIDTLVQIYECEDKPQFFLRFEHLINSLKETSEIQIIEWAKDYLTRQNIDIDVVNKLKIDDLLLLCLNCCKAKDNEIASILGIPLRNVPRKKTYLERRLSKINSRNI